LSATSYRVSVGNAFPALQLTIEDPMAPQKSDSPEPVTAAKPALSGANGPSPSPRSEALEAELAMLEAMLPVEAERSAQPTPVAPANDRGGAE
jgi:hypothetical protein